MVFTVMSNSGRGIARLSLLFSDPAGCCPCSGPLSLPFLLKIPCGLFALAQDPCYCRFCPKSLRVSLLLKNPVTVASAQDPCLLLLLLKDPVFVAFTHKPCYRRFCLCPRTLLSSLLTQNPAIFAFAPKPCYRRFY